MTLTVATITGTISSNTGAVRILTIFTGTGHTFFFLFGLGAGTGRFFSDTTLNFITFAILFFDIFYPEKRWWGAGAGITPT
tara:strand:- start:380 stop:622 length:243 start_codon:yes stop_codon:yes gene_type:complete